MLNGNASVLHEPEISLEGLAPSMVRGPVTPTRLRGFLEEEWARAFRHDHWNVGVADVPIQRFLEPGARPNIRWLPPPEPGTYYSDPFGLAPSNEILLEIFDFRAGKGFIGWSREGPDGRFSPPRTAFVLPFHASYPYLLEEAGSVYCVPETSQGGEVALYRALEFPHLWTKEATLVEGVRGTDNTILEHDGMFWLFSTDFDDGAYSKLRLWYARELRGPWRPHPRNPVKTDIRSARPGGTPFTAGGEIYRPAQDCSQTYGGSITINRIVRLTTTDFREEPAATVGPLEEGPSVRGIHTLSAFGERTLVDGKHLAFNRLEMARHFRESLEVRWPQMLRR